MAMVFGTRHLVERARHFDLLCENEDVHYMNIFNYLGIKLDNKLDFESHGKECLRLVAHKIYILSKIRNFINKNQAIMIYKSKILPYFDYGDIFYNSSFLRLTHKVQKHRTEL